MKADISDLKPRQHHPQGLFVLIVAAVSFSLSTINLLLAVPGVICLLLLIPEALAWAATRNGQDSNPVDRGRWLRWAVAIDEIIGLTGLYVARKGYARHLVLLAALNYEHGGYSDAEKLLRRAVKPKVHRYDSQIYPDTVCRLAAALLKQGKSAEAISALRDGINVCETNPDFADYIPAASKLNLRRQLVKVLADWSEPAAAEREAREVIAMEPVYAVSESVIIHPTSQETDVATPGKLRLTYERKASQGRPARKMVHVSWMLSQQDLLDSLDYQVWTEKAQICLALHVAMIQQNRLQESFEWFEQQLIALEGKLASQLLLRSVHFAILKECDHQLALPHLLKTVAVVMDASQKYPSQAAELAGLTCDIIALLRLDPDLDYDKFDLTEYARACVTAIEVGKIDHSSPDSQLRNLLQARRTWALLLKDRGAFPKALSLLDMCLALGYRLPNNTQLIEELTQEIELLQAMQTNKAGA